ncbi:MAG: DUF4293 domain-containing protein [Bacteroidota bacterium]
MIQRIQSFYLFLTTLLSLLFLKGSFLNFVDKTGSVIKVTFNGIVRDTGGQGFELIEKLLPISAFIIFIPVFSLVTIFIFKNRKIQLWLASSEIILVVGFIFVSIFYSWFIITEYGAEIVPGFKMVIPLLMLVFAVLAYRGIRKDDRLIKSNDRLR